MPETERQKRMIDSYDQLYKGKNFHQIWEGEISLSYKVPKYASLFAEYFRDKNLTILEVGAGDGYLTKLIMEKLNCRKYVATEISDEGVRRLKEKGIEAFKMDAEKLEFEDNSFDVVCCFDTMHHAYDPSKMASEMIRVARKEVFLIEANGSCLIRKLLEKTRRYKTVHESSYTPKQYASFFTRPEIRKIYFKPFLAVFPFTPLILKKPAIWISEIMERLPILKWQCSSVLISVEKYVK
ncbi:MAG: class I SAM-dependent methyltransferase [Candidatus Nealsonbacteria bacterium]